MTDRNPFGYASDTIRSTVDEYLAGDFLTGLTAPDLSCWMARMTALEVLWRLEITYPDGSVEARHLAFGAHGARWIAEEGGRPWGVLTAIPASVIVALLRGEMTTYSGYMSRRVAIRLYEPSRRGSGVAGGT